MHIPTSCVNISAAGYKVIMYVLYFMYIILTVTGSVHKVRNNVFFSCTMATIITISVQKTQVE